MQVQSVSNSPNFGAKIIVSDERINKFIKSSFMADSKKTLNLLDTFEQNHIGHIVSMSVRSILKNNGNREEYILAHNGITGKDTAVLIGSANKVTPENRKSFSVLIHRMLDTKSFWEKPIKNSGFDATSKQVKIEHDVFRLN